MVEKPSMKVKLPFPVDCWRVLPGKRSCQNGYVVFEDVFNVAEVSESDTVVAAQVLNRGTVEEVYRVFEGRFYRPAEIAWYNGKHLQTRNFPEDVDHLELGAVLVNGGKPLPPGDFVYEYSRYPSILKEVKAHEVLRFEDADQKIELRRALARTAYEEIALVIDGMLWMRIDEPHLIVKRPTRGFDNDLGTNLEITVSERRPVPGQRGGAVRNIPYEPPRLCPTFRMDRLDEMVDFIRDGRRESELETNFVLPDLQILRPEFFVYDDEADNLVRSADEVLDLTQGELRGASKTFLDAWHEVDVAVAKGLISLESCSGEEIETGLDLISSVSRNEKARKIASRALDRFSMRSIGPSFR
jgi:hypothetical protein